MKQVNIRIPFRILTLVMGLFLSLDRKSTRLNSSH